MSVQTLLDSTIARYIDPDKTTWLDTELLSYVQAGVDYINQLLVNRNDIYGTKSGTIALADGTATVTFGECSMTDFMAMYKGSRPEESGVWIEDLDANLHFLEATRETDVVNYGSAADDENLPEKYYVTSTGFGFLPIPDDVYTVSCLYFCKQATLSVGSSMPFNDMFNEAIKAFVTSMAAARTERDIVAMMALYNELEKQALVVCSGRNPVKLKIRNRSLE